MHNYHHIKRTQLYNFVHSDYIFNQFDRATYSYAACVDAAVLKLDQGKIFRRNMYRPCEIQRFVCALGDADFIGRRR